MRAPSFPLSALCKSAYNLCPSKFSVHVQHRIPPPAMEAILIPIAMPNLGLIMGALCLGTTGAAMLYGATNVQIYLYIKNYREDQTMIKCSVAFLWLMDTLHMAFIVVEVWHYLINSFGNFEALRPVNWSHRVQQLLNVIIILAVQNLYAWRVWRLTSQKTQIWRWIVGGAAICGYTAGIILVVKSFQLRSFKETNKVRWEIILAISMITFSDVVFAAGLCHLISLSIGPTLGLHYRTKAMGCIIMRYVLISGTLTSLCSLSALVCFCVIPNGFVALAIMFVTTKLYINSYLALLNARKSIRNRGSITNLTSTQMSDLQA
ncbi:hypothetical protein F5887DRAFT_957385 [Amanita rubescens]|nr:hypothetical protein F5887DRAFT_957385 [Amanita rubescens]